MNRRAFGLFCVWVFLTAFTGFEGVGPWTWPAVALAPWVWSYATSNLAHAMHTGGDIYLLRRQRGGKVAPCWIGLTDEWSERARTHSTTDPVPGRGDHQRWASELRRDVSCRIRCCTTGRQQIRIERRRLRAARVAADRGWAPRLDNTRDHAEIDPNWRDWVWSIVYWCEGWIHPHRSLHSRQPTAAGIWLEETVAGAVGPVEAGSRPPQAAPAPPQSRPWSDPVQPVPPFHRPSSPPVGGDPVQPERSTGTTVIDLGEYWAERELVSAGDGSDRGGSPSSPPDQQRLRQEVRDAVAAGWSYSRIEEELGVKRATAHRWAKS